MQLHYAHVIVSICDIAVIYTWASCHMQACFWDLSLVHLGVASSLGQIGCVLLPYTRPTSASVNP